MNNPKSGISAQCPVGARDSSCFAVRLTGAIRHSPAPAPFTARSGLKSALLFCSILTSVFWLSAHAQPTSFTYQGQLTENGSPANGLYDFAFTLYDSCCGVTGVTVVGGPLTTNSIAVSNGLFTVTLDFGSAAFNGSERWLQIGVVTNGGGPLSMLDPRQRITSTPYAISAGDLNGVVSGSSLSGTYGNAVNFNNPGNSFIGNGAGLANVNAKTLGGRAPTDLWQLGGNAGTAPGGDFLGTTDSQPLELKINGLRGLRLEDNGDGGDLDVVADGAPNVIAGAPVNFVGPGVVGATIAGGGATNHQGFVSSNSVLADYSLIGGGYNNRIEMLSQGGTIAGGIENGVSSNTAYATIAGGERNDIGPNADISVIGGGNDNNIAANSAYGTIAGGNHNDIGADSNSSTIGGGGQNDIGANSAASTISGGLQNSITGARWAAIAGGNLNAIGASADYAFAAGRRAKANHAGSFVWGDSQNADVTSTTANQITFRCGSGVRFMSGRAGGNQQVSWVPGIGTWAFTSDRNLKEKFQPVETRTILEKVCQLPITEWNYIGYEQRHIGPTAQDFHTAFPLNEDDTHLNGADLHGVALAAIQGLNQKLETSDRKSEARCQHLQKALQQRDREIAGLKRELEELKQLITPLAKKGASR